MRIIAGERRGMRLELPGKRERTRPTEDKTKESVFNILQPLRPDAVVLDLFAGTGQIGLEFLSRGARRAYFCEKSRTMAQTLRRNVEKAGYPAKSEVYVGDYRAALAAFNEHFDYIYLDPPFGFGMEKEAMAMIRRLKRLAPDGEVILETAAEEMESEIDGYALRFRRQYGHLGLRIFKESV